jgi:hypothetical protein
MSEAQPTRGVFLSYAREDTEAARRIADALRGFGVEVWFDQSELRGGDAWDAKIKSQIRECALFVAIISGNTQARGEGYFRREWKLAIERTHDMAAGIPFLIPLAVDQTPESKALVPEEFMRVQWTRLAGGAPTAQFVERIKRLVERQLIQKGHAKMALGHPGDAVRAGNRAVEISPGSIDALDGALNASINAKILLYCGYKERALTKIARLLRTPGGVSFFNVYELKRDPRNTLRDDPRMKAMLDDPANNAQPF